MQYFFVKYCNKIIVHSSFHPDYFLFLVIHWISFVTCPESLQQPVIVPAALSTGNSLGLRRHLSGLHFELHPSSLALALSCSLSLSFKHIFTHTKTHTAAPEKAVLTRTTNPTNASPDCVLCTSLWWCNLLRSVSSSCIVHTFAFRSLSP